MYINELEALTTKLKTIEEHIKNEEKVLKHFTTKTANTVEALGNAANSGTQISIGVYNIIQGGAGSTAYKSSPILLASGIGATALGVLGIGYGVYDHKSKVTTNTIYTTNIEQLVNTFKVLPSPTDFNQKVNENLSKNNPTMTQITMHATLSNKYNNMWNLTNSSIKQINRLNEIIDTHMHKRTFGVATLSRVFGGDGSKTIDMAMACRTWILANLIEELIPDQTKKITSEIRISDITYKIKAIRLSAIGGVIKRNIMKSKAQKVPQILDQQNPNKTNEIVPQPTLKILDHQTLHIKNTNTKK